MIVIQQVTQRGVKIIIVNHVKIMFLAMITLMEHTVNIPIILRLIIR